MAIEKSGFNLLCEFTPTSGTAIEFCARSKTPFGMAASAKIDTNCDREGKYKRFDSAEQVEITDATVTVGYDQELENQLALLVGTVGVFVIESTSTLKKTTNPNVWIKEVKPGSIDLEGSPTMDITFESGGGLAGVPTVSDV